MNNVYQIKKDTKFHPIPKATLHSIWLFSLFHKLAQAALFVAALILIACTQGLLSAIIHKCLLIKASAK